MDIKNYFKYTGDIVEDIESMSSDNGNVNKVTTHFGNVLYWEQNTDKVIFAEWKVPNSPTINKLEEEQLNEISGQYYLQSYGENMRAQ